MDIEFDPAKDAQNIAKHGVSLSLGASMDMEAAVIDQDTRKEYGEPRFNALGMIGQRLYAMTFTVRTVIRIISLRKANARERKRYTA